MGEASSRTSYELAALLTKVAVLCFPPRPPDNTMSQQMIILAITLLLLALPARLLLPSPLLPLLRPEPGRRTITEWRIKTRRRRTRRTRTKTRGGVVRPTILIC